MYKKKRYIMREITGFFYDPRGGHQVLWGNNWVALQPHEIQA